MMDKNTKKLKAMEEETIPKLLLGFSSATFAALLFNSLYTLTDALIVSHGVNDYAMGGVSIILPFVIIQGAIASTVGGGAASIVSRYLGKEEYGKAGNVTAHAMMTFYVTAAVITLLGFIFMKPTLNLMGVTDDIYAYAREYYIIILAGNIFSTGFSSLIRAEGAKIYGLLIWVIPISINIVLDLLFVFGFDMGVKGSAIATVICQFTSFSMSILYFTRFTCQKFNEVSLSMKTVKEIIAMGFPTLVQAGTFSIASLALNKTLSIAAGTAGVTVFAYISKAISFAVVPFTAISQALSPVVGFNYGAKNHDRVKEAVSYSFKISYIYAACALVTLELIPKLFIRIFTENTELITLGAVGIRIIALTLPFTPVVTICGAIMQAMGKKKESFLIYASTFIALVPATIMAARISLNAIWGAYVAAYAISAVFAVVLLKRRGIQ